MKRDRIAEIAELLDKRGKLSLEQLEEYFPNVSQMTLRRDLFQLEEEGKMSYKLEELNKKIEISKLNEYVLLMGDTKRLLWKNFISGISKGVGTGIGFTILGAIVLIILILKLTQVF